MEKWRISILYQFTYTHPIKVLFVAESLFLPKIIIKVCFHDTIMRLSKAFLESTLPQRVEGQSYIFFSVIFLPFFSRRVFDYRQCHFLRLQSLLHNSGRGKEQKYV